MGRTVDINVDYNDKVTCVRFGDKEGDEFSITSQGSDLFVLDQNDHEVIVFFKKDLDNMIRLLQAAKDYNI